MPSSDQLGGLSRKNILLVEDNYILSMALADHLQAKGHAVRAAYDGLEALRASRATWFDLMLVELVLPGLDGVTFLENVRETDPNCKAVVISGCSELLEQEAAALREVGADATLKKPFSFSEVDTVIAQLGRESLV